MATASSRALGLICLHHPSPHPRTQRRPNAGQGFVHRMWCVCDTPSDQSRRGAFQVSPSAVGGIRTQWRRALLVQPRSSLALSEEESPSAAQAIPGSSERSPGPSAKRLVLVKLVELRPDNGDNLLLEIHVCGPVADSGSDDCIDVGLVVTRRSHATRCPPQRFFHFVRESEYPPDPHSAIIPGPAGATGMVSCWELAGRSPSSCCRRSRRAPVWLIEGVQVFIGLGCVRRSKYIQFAEA